MTENMKAELSAKLLALSAAFADLGELLDTVTENDQTVYEQIEDSFGETYPFQESFDVLAVDVANWTEDIITNVNADK